jgi:hypothetical protein
MRKDYTHISVVLDESGSMDVIKDATIEGFNDFVRKNRSLPGKTTTQLTRFNGKYAVGPVEEQALTELTDRSYLPGGTTALYDAIGNTINSVGLSLSNMKEEERPDKVIFVIVTDGEENSSREFSRDQIFKMITLQTDTYKWDFVFMGANQDAYQVGTGLGINGINTITYGYNNRQAHQAWAGMTTNAMSYRLGESVSMSFNDDQRKEQE